MGKLCEKCGAERRKAVVISLIVVAVILILIGTGIALYLNSNGYQIRKNMKLAEENYEAGEYQEARSYYKEALRLDETIAEAYLKLAEIYLADKSYDKAIKQLKRGIKSVGKEENEENEKNIEIMNTKLVDAYLEKAVFYLEVPDYGQALEILKEGIKDTDDGNSFLTDKLVEVYLGEADSFLAQGDYNRAVEILEEGKAETGDGKNILGDRLEEIVFVGKSVDEVKVTLLNIGLTPEMEYQESTEYDQGIVMKVSIEPGNMIAVLTVSAESENVEVPDVVGLVEAEGAAALEKKGFVVNKTEGYDEYIDAGDIIIQSPEAGEKALSGASVTITISLGKPPEKGRVPNLMGKSEEEAMAVLEEVGLLLGEVSEVNNENTDLKGLVCYQSYSAGSYVEVGTKVDISISLGSSRSTFKFTDAITAPTAEEDPNFRGGTLVTVTLIADDGTTLLSTQTSDFPIELNITGIKSQTGYILYQYESKEIRRPVTFVSE